MPATGATPALREEALGELGLVRHQVLRQLGIGRCGHRRRRGATLQQVLGKRRRHEKAHLLAVPPGGDVDANHLTVLIERRSAADAGVQ